MLLKERGECLIYDLLDELSVFFTLWCSNDVLLYFHYTFFFNACCCWVLWFAPRSCIFFGFLFLFAKCCFCSVNLLILTRTAHLYNEHRLVWILENVIHHFANYTISIKNTHNNYLQIKLFHIKSTFKIPRTIRLYFYNIS